MTDDMLDKLKEFAEQLRERGYNVEVGHSDNDQLDRWYVDITLDKTIEKGDDLYQ